MSLDWNADYESPREKLAAAINKILAPKVVAVFEGEELLIQSEGFSLWLDVDFELAIYCKQWYSYYIKDVEPEGIEPSVAQL